MKLSVLLEARLYTALVSAAKNGDVEEFADLFSHTHRSAADVWMDEKQMSELMTLIAKGKKVKSVSFDLPAKQKEEAHERAMKKIQTTDDRMKAQGYEEFAEEENYDQLEKIYVQK